MSDRGPTAAPPDAPPAGYEKRDASARGIVIGLVVGVLVMVVALVALDQLYITTREEVEQENVRSRVDPRLQELHARETRQLTTYGVVDGEKGIVHIPIDRAMKLMVEEAYQKQKAQARKK